MNASLTPLAAPGPSPAGLSDGEIEALSLAMAGAYADTYRAVAETNFAVHRVARDKAGPASALLTMLDCTLNTARAASMGPIFAMEWDPEYPMLGKLLTQSRGIPGRPNADAHYHIASLHGDHSYRLRGNRGTALIFDAIIHKNSMAVRQRPLVDSLGQRGIEVPTGTEVDILLSRARPADLPGDRLWLELPEGDCFLYVRQYFNDWDTEEPARLTIERVGAVYPPPLPTVEVMQRRVEMMRSFLESNQQVASGDSFAMLVDEPNTLKPFLFPVGAFQNLQYICGYGICRPDEALIITFDAPAAHYWGININDAYGGSLHPHMRQVSLNGHQTRIDSDGRYRWVICQHDIGVANWLDNGGRDLISLGVRLHDCTQAPTFEVNRVPLAEVFDHLPKDTPRVTPPERQVLLRNRLMSAYRRGVTDY